MSRAARLVLVLVVILAAGIGAALAGSRHADPELEALLPATLGGVALTIESQAGTELATQSAAFDAYLAGLGRSRADFSLASAYAQGGLEAEVGAWRVRGGDPAKLLPGFITAVQASSTRALKAGASLPKVLELVRKFRKKDAKTPIVLMGYYNPIHAYGTAKFARDVAAAGVDGLIAVDLPIEEDEVLRLPAAAQGVDLVRFVTPTTDEARLARILEAASGYLYYVSVAGVTGTKSFDQGQVAAALEKVSAATQLPVAVGFGIKTPEQAATIAALADGVVVGSAIVGKVAETMGQPKETVVKAVTELCTSLAQATHKSARVQA